MARTSTSRSGALLLIVCSLLVLFSMVAITYVLSATQHRKAAIALSVYDQFGSDPKYLADLALYQMLVDTINPHSALFGHGILQDVYGHSGVYGQITSVVDYAQTEQLLEITLQPFPPSQPYERRLEEMGYLGGCVLTILDGEAAGMSTHIIRQDLATPTKVLASAFTGDDLRAPPRGGGTSNPRMRPSPGDRFWINGQAFSGYGFGFNPSSQLLDQQHNGQTISRTGNLSALFTKEQSQDIEETLRAAFQTALTSANESYDAADLQNWHIAYVPDQGDRIIPSYHRPGLIQKAGASRYTMLRPNRQDHPNFTGSNPPFDPVTGPWDVDTDGDGRPDAVWIDIGLPVETRPDGTRVKPLVAIQCVPLDGAPNVNASGSLAASDQDPNLPSGIGTGPADIDLNRLVQQGGREFAQAIMRGNQSHPGRYGANGQPGNNQDQDRFWTQKQIVLPKQWIWHPKYPQSRHYGCPPDLFGRVTVTLEPITGRPIWRGFDGIGTGAVVPYELDLGRTAPRGPLPSARDNLFTVAEYERFLRQYDGDAWTLPNRLWELAATLRPYARRFTVESWDIPVPSVQQTADLRRLTQRMAGSQQNPHPARSYVDILRARILAAGGNPARLLPAYVPPEMFQGLRMDLNRAFGNGLDDNANGVVDEGGVVDQYTGEAHLGEMLATAGNNQVRANLLNDDPIITNPNLAREIICRHLYVMAMTLMTPATEGYNYGSAGHRRLAHQLAQWAVNVVDFRDRDSIMTRFQYDPNPFDGWTPAATGNDTILFGCERPELIITEAISGHDMKLEPNRTQQQPPEGWLYIELYNPWTDREAVPGELYQHSRSADISPGVVLDQLSPPLNPGDPQTAKPTWRLLLHRGDLTTEELGSNDVEGPFARGIYFDNKHIDLPRDGTRNHWDKYVRREMPVAPVKPGQYCVIGSRQDQRIMFGGNEVRIRLFPSATSEAGRVEVQGSNSSTRDNIVAIVHDFSRDGLEPTTATHPGRMYRNDYPGWGASGYPRSTFQYRNPQTGTSSSHRFEPSLGEYTPTVPGPLDAVRSDERGSDLTTPGTRRGWRVINLQRLADPSKPFHSVLNPFLTIDEMPLDLHVYNSRNPQDAAGGSMRMATRERGTNSARRGFVNDIWPPEPRNQQLDGDGPPGFVHSLGYQRNPIGTPGEAPQAGGGNSAYPWFTWLNRPFASHFELMLVPHSQSAFLLRQFGMVAPNGQDNSYVSRSGAFSHLPNFFYSQPQAQQAASNTQTLREFARLFEFVNVPSQFIGTELYGNPQKFAAVPYMRPPFFNKISSYREPGKINLNAVSEREAWSAVIGAGLGMDDAGFWRQFSMARAGQYGDLSHMGEPFRTIGEADLDPNEAPSRPVNATVLRQSMTGDGSPLFAYRGNQERPDRDPNRNPYFRFQGFQRMGNLITTRSNTYAIWVTVGYFEAESASTPDHPTGYQLGQEYGWDTGNTQRHRAFYIIDRTIPVASQPGRINNVHRAILVNRRIE